MGAPQVDFQLDGDARPLIPPGNYQLRFLHWQTAIMFAKAPKLILTFKVIEPGPYFDAVELPAYFNCKRLVGKAGRYGGFKVGWQSDFLLQYVQLFHRDVKRLDRTPMSEFERHIFVGKVKTVTTTSKQRERPEALQYSVVQELVKVLAP
jgi:hypothetical protein